MSRVWAIVVLALGAFLLAVAAGLPLIGEPLLFRIPLDQFSVTVAEADNATVINPTTLTEETGRHLIASRRVVPRVHGSTHDRVVFDVSLTLQDPDRPGTPKAKVVDLTIDKLALDRRTSEAVPIEGESYADRPVVHKGLTYKFPFHTEKKTYDYFDNTARATYPIRYVGTETIKGLETYKFQMTVEPVKIGDQDFDGKLLGDAAGPVKAPRFYENVRTIWVEPTSGLIVRGREEQKQTLHNAAGEPKFTLIEADLDWNDKTIGAQAALAQDTLSKYRIVVYIVPAMLVVLGLIMLAIGAVLLSRAGNHRGARRASGRSKQTVSV